MTILALTCKGCSRPFQAKRKRGLPRSFCDGCRIKRAKYKKRGRGNGCVSN